VIALWARPASGNRDLQAAPVEHCDATSRVPDNFGLLKLQSTASHAFSAHSQHIGDQLLSHHEFIAVQPI
jgi:hypothetical protein